MRGHLDALAMGPFWAENPGESEDRN
jgi:hypothetical protein